MASALVALLATAAAAEDPARAAHLARILPGPDFELVGLDGQLHRLADYRGQVVLINFWATWCTSCRAEMPALDALYREFAAQRVVVLGISTDAEGAAKVSPFVRELAIHYPVLLDPEDVSTALFGGLDGYPSTFILDREGLIYSSYLGAQDEATFRADLLYLLAAPPSPGEPLIRGGEESARRND